MGIHVKHVPFAFAKNVAYAPVSMRRTPSYTADLVPLVCVGTHPHVTASAPGIWAASAINAPTAASGQIERNIYRRFATRLSVFYRRANSITGCCRCCTLARVGGNNGTEISNDSYELCILSYMDVTATAEISCVRFTCRYVIILL